MPDRKFYGELDEIRISNIVRYSDDYTPQINIFPDENTLSLWKFNAGEGDILYDHSGNQNHGTIYGTTWVENIYGCSDSLASSRIPSIAFEPLSTKL